MSNPSLQFGALQATYLGAIFDPRTPDVARQIVERCVDASGVLLWNAVKQRTPRNSSDLWNSITFHRPVSAHGLTEGIVGTPRPHALPIEFGRTAGAKGPPYEPILLWVRRNWSKLSDRFKTVESAAYVVRALIHERGFSPRGRVGPKGARMFEKGLEASVPQIESLFRAAAAEVAAAYGAS